MKKVLVSLLILLLVVPSCLADGFDLPGMTDEALEQLNRDLQIELFTRHSAGTGVDVPPGRYIAGVDFPSGRYQIIVADDVLAETIEVYDSEDAKYGTSYWLGSMYGGTTANIDLKDGAVLEVRSHTVTMRVFTSLF